MVRSSFQYSNRLRRSGRFRRVKGNHEGHEVGRAKSDGSQTKETLRRAAKRYFSLATTNSGAHSSALLISESGKAQMAWRADSA